MTDILRVTAAEAVLPGVLKLGRNDGCQAIVDLRAAISEGQIYQPIRDPENFKKIQVESYGHSIHQGKEGDEEVYFGCDRLRDMAEEQAALLARAN
jgi:hypothetical protein